MQIKKTTNFKVKSLGKKMQDVYDIETQNTHRFFANDILVHNSVYLSLNDLIKRVFNAKDVDVNCVLEFMDKICNEKLEPFINKSYEELVDLVNAYAQKMTMSREILADKAIWVAKKRYIVNVYDNEGVRYKEPKKKVMGLELKKSSTPFKCREMLNNSVDIIMKGTENELIDYIKECRKEFESFNIEDISFPRGVSDIEKYADDTSIFTKGCPIHTKGALIYNKMVVDNGFAGDYELIKSGDKIKFIYLIRPNTFYNNNVLSFKDMFPKKLKLEKYIDYEKQFDKSFIEPLKLILNSIGWKSEEESSLESFMG
jgi:hypothetical protein